jgi:hypothetical protein
MNKLAMAAGLGIGGILLYRSLKSSSSGGAGILPHNEADVDAVTRGLLVETSFNRDPDEMAQIIWVMANRAKKHGNSLAQVITPPGRPNWNKADDFREWFHAGPRRYGKAKFDRAKVFVREVLSGKFPNRIGNRVQFLHPSGMPRCGGDCPPGKAWSRRSKKCYTCANTRGRGCVQTGAGNRCLPKWSRDEYANIKTVGGGRFS